MKDENPISLLQSEWEKHMYLLEETIQYLAFTKDEKAKQLIKNLGAQKYKIQCQINARIREGEWK